MALLEKGDARGLGRLFRSLDVDRVDLLAEFFSAVFETSVELEKDRNNGAKLFGQVFEALRSNDKGEAAHLVPVAQLFVRQLWSTLLVHLHRQGDLEGLSGVVEAGARKLGVSLDRFPTSCQLVGLVSRLTP